MPFPQSHLTRWQSVEKLDHDHLNEILDKFEELQRIVAANLGQNQKPAPRSQCVLVRIVGTEAGGGKYKGEILSLAGAKVSPSSNLSTDDIGIFGSAALVLNMLEVGKSTHILDPTADQKHFIGYLGSGFATDGRQTVLIHGFQTVDCATP